MDRENIIKGIRECDLNGGLFGSCPYINVIALLKRHEAKTPIEYEHNGYWIFICPMCGSHKEDLSREWNYCPFCGQAVKWE